MSHFLEKNELKLEFIGFEKKQSILKFKFTDNLSNQEEYLDFSIRYWMSYVKYDYGHDQ